MNNKPKILISLFRFPYPAIDGTRWKLLYNIAEGLREDFDIEFFIISIDSVSNSDIEYVEKHFGPVHLFRHSRLAFLINDIPALWNGLPHQSQAFHFSDAQQWLDDHIQDYDAYYVHEIRMTEFFINYSQDIKSKIIVDFNDAISLHYQQASQKSPWWKRWFYVWEGARVACYESKVVQSFSHFSSVSEYDKKHILKNCSIDITEKSFRTIPHGVECDTRHAWCDQETIYFIGSLSYQPNRDAIMYFLNNIWDLLKQKIPSIRLLIIGAGELSRDLVKQDVTITGFVDDVFETVKHCKALVAPIRFAGGTPSKIIQSLAFGIPVVTTPAGSSGILANASDNPMVIINEHDHEQWVDAIVTIIRDDGYQKHLAEKSRIFIEQHYTKESSQKKWRDFFWDILKTA